MSSISAESLTPNGFMCLLQHLREIIHDLPRELPLGNPETSTYSCFLSSQLDGDLLKQIGSEVGALNEQFKQVFGWKARTTGDQILSIEEQGEPILAAVDVLEEFHIGFPEDDIIVHFTKVS